MKQIISDLIISVAVGLLLLKPSFGKGPSELKGLLVPTRG